MYIYIYEYVRACSKLFLYINIQSYPDRAVDFIPTFPLRFAGLQGRSLGRQRNPVAAACACGAMGLTRRSGLVQRGLAWGIS